MASLPRQVVALMMRSSSSSSSSCLLPFSFLQALDMRFLAPFDMLARSLSSPAEELGFESDGLYNDIKALEREYTLHRALSRVAGDFGKEPMLHLRRFFSSKREPVLSTGSLRLDLALGIGRLPKGRIVEIYGKEASGKTTLALHIIKVAQKLGGCCAYFDVENAMDYSLTEAVGINTENLLFLCPSSAENLLSAVDTLTKSSSVDVIVVDSVAALIPQCEIDNPVSSNEGDVQSVIMTRALRKIHSSLSQSRTLIIFVNQVKGLKICVEVVKNKLGPAMKKTELGILFGKGLYFASEVLELACEYGIIAREGTSYYIHWKVFHDKAAAEIYLVRHEEILQKIALTLGEHLFGGGQVDP